MESLIIRVGTRSQIFVFNVRLFFKIFRIGFNFGCVFHCRQSDRVIHVVVAQVELVPKIIAQERFMVFGFNCIEPFAQANYKGLKPNYKLSKVGH